jgi:ubiquinone/menaquinone biosynthesis C-methylase UbiE
MTPTPKPPKKVDQYDDPEHDYVKYWEGRTYEHEAEEMAVRRLLDGKHFKHAVDVGGGYGRLSVLLKNFADEVTLAEPSHKQLQVAEDYLHDHPDINRRTMAAHALDFSDDSIDLVTMIRVIHHLPDPTEELHEIARILSPDGYAVIEVANYSHVRNRLKHLVRHKKLPKHPVDIRSASKRLENEVPFVNHNPKQITQQLAQAGLRVERILSVSNLRNAGLKKLMPKRVMLAIEGVLQPTLARSYFGPSVFFLVRKEPLRTATAH